MQRNKIIVFFCTVLDAQPGILKSQKDRTQKEGPGMKTSWNHEEQWTRTRRTWRTKKFVLDLIFWYFDTPFDHPLRLWLRTRAPVSVTVPWKFQAWRPQYVPLARSRKHSKANYVITKDVLQRLISFWMDSKIATPNSGYMVFAVRAAFSGGRFTSQQAMLEHTQAKDHLEKQNSWKLGQHVFAAQGRKKTRGNFPTHGKAENYFTTQGSSNIFLVAGRTTFREGAGSWNACTKQKSVPAPFFPTYFRHL